MGTLFIILGSIVTITAWGLLLDEKEKKLSAIIPTFFLGGLLLWIGFSLL